MRIAILSDIHDQIWNLAAALKKIETADLLICCGDLCSPFILHQLGRGFAKPIHVVFGNNDGDLYRITAAARSYPHVSIHGHLFEGEYDGRRIAANHYPDIALPVAESGRYDLVCYGHNHRHRIQTMAKALAVNPGTLLGAAFTPDARPVDVPATCAVYDTAKPAAEILTVV
jgi:hypothetical protein